MWVHKISASEHNQNISQTEKKLNLQPYFKLYFEEHETTEDPQTPCNKHFRVLYVHSPTNSFILFHYSKIWDFVKGFIILKDAK